MTQVSVYIDISGYRVVRDEKGRDYFVYIIKISLGRYAWTVYRRFTQFRNLCEQLRKTIPDCPPCPPKRFIGGNSTEFLEQRRLDLLNWVRALARDERVCRSQDFHEFLRDQANVKPPGMIDAPITSATFSQSMSAEQSSTSPQGMEPARPPALNVQRHGMQRHDSTPLTPGSVTPTPVYTPNGNVRPITNVRGANVSNEGHMSSSKNSEPRVSFREFSLLKVVGKGSFGKVMQVRKKDTGRIYAMKVLHKANIINRNQVEHTRTERAVLGRIVHPFIVGLNYAFQTPDKLYFVLDYCAGGELFFHLGKEGRFREDRARFYAAQITLALEHLHAMNVIYRDLKPENVLLDHRGNVRLTDFGLSKENVYEVDKGATSFCGTPEYLAPEVLDRKGHGRAVDWWSLGALLYEMLTGLPPFYNKERDKLFHSILHGKLEFPPYVSDVAKDICAKLLNRDPTKRLGSGPGDAAEVKAHPFFASIDWVALYELRVPIPFVPAVTSSLDTSQFDSEFTSLPILSPDGTTGEHISGAGAASGAAGVHASGIGHPNGASNAMGVDIAPGGTPKTPGISASVSRRIFDGFTYVAPHQLEGSLSPPEKVNNTDGKKGPSFDFTAADRMLLEKRKQQLGGDPSQTVDAENAQAVGQPQQQQQQLQPQQQATQPQMQSQMPVQQTQVQQQSQMQQAHAHAQPKQQRYFTPPNCIPNKGLSQADYDSYVSQVHQHEMYSLYDYFCKQLPPEKTGDAETLQHLQQYVKNLYLYEMQTYRQEQEQAAQLHLQQQQQFQQQLQQQQTGTHVSVVNPGHQVANPASVSAHEVNTGHLVNNQMNQGQYGHQPGQFAQAAPDAVPMSYQETFVPHDDDITMAT